MKKPFLEKREKKLPPEKEAEIILIRLNRTTINSPVLCSVHALGQMPFIDPIRY